MNVNELTMWPRCTQPKGGEICPSTRKGTPESVHAMSVACAKVTDNLGVGGREWLYLWIHEMTTNLKSHSSEAEGQKYLQSQRF